MSAKDKDIDLKLKFVNEALVVGCISLHRIESAETPVDILTKIVSLPVFDHLTDILCLTRIYVCFCLTAVANVKFSLYVLLFLYCSSFFSFSAMICSLNL